MSGALMIVLWEQYSSCCTMIWFIPHSFYHHYSLIQWVHMNKFENRAAYVSLLWSRYISDVMCDTRYNSILVLVLAEGDMTYQFPGGGGTNWYGVAGKGHVNSQLYLAMGNLVQKTRTRFCISYIFSTSWSSWYGAEGRGHGNRVNLTLVVQIFSLENMKTFLHFLSFFNTVMQL